MITFGKQAGRADWSTFWDWIQICQSRSLPRSGSRFCVSDWFRWWALASSLIGKTKHKFGYTNTQKAEQIQKVFKCPHILKSTKTNILRDWSQWLVSANRPLSDWLAYKQQRRVKFQMNYLLHVWGGFKYEMKNIIFYRWSNCFLTITKQAKI